jgi:hypothetical protein
VPLAPGFVTLAPNPVKSRVTICFDLAKAAGTRLQVYDVSGRLIESLLDEVRAAGQHQVVWNLAQDNDGRIPSGIYFIRLQVNGHQAARRVVVRQ